MIVILYSKPRWDYRYLISLYNVCSYLCLSSDARSHVALLSLRFRFASASLSLRFRSAFISTSSALIMYVVISVSPKLSGRYRFASHSLLLRFAQGSIKRAGASSKTHSLAFSLGINNYNHRAIY